jgi:NRAMP (natural resistance-associated macrophage protein)-like metal ion transporter
MVKDQTSVRRTAAPATGRAASCVERGGIPTKRNVEASAPAETGLPAKRKLFQVLGPGLITGAADDDPSGIATYSQVGAQFGYGLGWTLVFSYPLMVAIQEISARIGRVTGFGIAGNLRRHYSAWLSGSIVLLLLFANLINLGADLGAMGAALKLMIGGPALVYVVLFAALSAGLQVFVHYARYVSILKWGCLALFSYVICAFIVHVPWGEVALAIVWPPLSLKADYLMAVVAVLGTTISPYLFFWQAGQEVEDTKEGAGARPLTRAPEQARGEFARIRIDTYVGMGISNLVALFIVITTAATLNAHGVTDIQTSAQAAEALRAVAGPLTFAVFAAGIIGTGMLALPALAGSAAYALGETLSWHVGLARLPLRAKAFYATIAVGMVLGVALNFTPIDPIKALYWSAVLNGVVAVPVMITMMLMTRRRLIMAGFTLPLSLQIVGWLATVTMAVTVVAMVWSWLE